MGEAHALAPVEEGVGGEEDIVVHEAGAVGHFRPQVGVVVVLEDVSGDTGADGLPVEPEAVVAIDQVVVADDDINGGVQFDAAQLFPKIAFFSMESQRERILAQARQAQKRKKCIFVL
jgi:hypothetical protein